MTLIDERSTPSLREIIGELLRKSKSADIAVSHFRLVGLDLMREELERVESCRVILRQLNAANLQEVEQAKVLAGFARSGRLAVRAAPHHVWTPDLSVFQTHAGRSVALVGAHYFGQPYPLFGLALTCVTDDPVQVRMCATRFEDLWAAGYDVLPVICEALDRVAL
ncbi:MAG TPA: hypothetical protein VM100_07840 [Longimicrobiales bacterium]|nr:hypothetical protein [Longimicrobiales bacterium]